MMENYVKFDYLDTAISNGELEAIAITAMSYASGQSVTFYQGQERLASWNRSRRRGENIPLTIDHLMASTAIPGLFPAVKDRAVIILAMERCVSSSRSARRCIWAPPNS